MANPTNTAYSVNTIADLLWLTGASNYETIILLGYYNINDDGGGEFYWDSSSTATDDGGLIIKPSGVGVSSPGRWIRVITGNLLNVKWFGAKADYTYSNPSPMDNNIIIKYVIELLTAGQEVVIPEGSYYISSLIIDLPNNCKYTQKGTFYSDSSTAATSVITLGSANSPKTGCYVSGLSLIWKEAGISHGTSNSIGIQVQNIFSSHIEIKEAYGFAYGIRIYGLGYGNAYNKYYLGYLVDNQTTLQLDHDTTGFVNENIFFGGHFTYSSYHTASSTDVHIDITSPTNNAINNNKFIGPSLESATTTPTAVSIGGLFNCILYPRYEFTGATSSTIAFKFLPGSANNQITGGYIWESSQIADAGTTNSWRSRNSIKEGGGTATMPLMTLQSNNTSAAKLIDLLNSGGTETFYVLGTGEVWSNSYGFFALGIRLNNQTGIYVGSSSPESHVTADPGSIYLNTLGGNGRSIYIKESGTNTNTGWVGLPATGSSIFNGGASTYTIAHGLGATPSYFSAIPTSHDAAGSYYVTAEPTNIVVNYLTVPASGTNNISFNWEAKK